MADWVPLLTMPNVTLSEPIDSDDVTFTSTGDQRLQEVMTKHPSFRTYVDSFTNEFGRAVAPSFVMVRADAPDAFKTVEAMAAFRDAIGMSIVPLAWARSLRYGRGVGRIHYTNWFYIYPWMLDRNYDALTAMTMAAHAFHDVRLLKAQSSPGFSPVHLDHRDIDRPLLDEILSRWQRCYRAHERLHHDVVLFRSLNMANTAGLMPAGPEVTMYDVGRSMALWVSAFEILSPASSQAHLQVYANLKTVHFLRSDVQGLHSTFKDRRTRLQEMLPCWMYGEMHRARNDFLHGNPITPKRLTVKDTGRSLYVYASILYRLALTGFLDLRFREIAPPLSETQSFATHLAARMSFNSFQQDLEAGLSTVLYSEEQQHSERSEHVAIPPRTGSLEMDG